MKNNKRPIELKKINVTFIVFIFILCALLISSSIGLILTFKKYTESTNQASIISRAAIQLQEVSDYLTEEARLFVITTDSKHMDNYFEELTKNQRREKAIFELEENTHNNIAIEYLEKALTESHKLELIEFYAMKMVVESKNYAENPAIEIPDQIKDIKLYPEDESLSNEYKISKAWIIMFSKDYITQKRKISEYKSKAMEEILDYSDEVLFESYTKLKTNFTKMFFCIGMIFIFNLGLFIVIIYFVIIPLYNHIKNIRSGKRLDKSNSKEFNILSDTYNEMYDKNAANELLLKHKAEHDELTGIFNRTAFSQIKMAYTNSPENIALIIIDVDYFKQINDTYGHSCGDLVLQRVSSVLVKTFRTSDFVCRVGGDEFTVIVTKCDNDVETNKKVLTQKLLNIQKTLSLKSDSSPAVTLSCGIAFSSSGYSESLYEHADTALYEVKRAGRKDFKFYSNDN